MIFIPLLSHSLKLYSILCSLSVRQMWDMERTRYCRSTHGDCDKIRRKVVLSLTAEIRKVKLQVGLHYGKSGFEGS